MSIVNGVVAQPFPCDNGSRLYFFRNIGPNGTLSYFENYSTTPVITNLCPMPTFNHNGLAGNPVDGYLYYLNNNILTRLSSNCTATPVCNIGFTSPYGGFDLSGLYWTVDGNDLVAIDMASCSVVKGPFPINTNGIVDLAFSPLDCYIYIGNQRYDTTGTLDPNYTSPPIGNIFTSFAGSAIGSDGNIYAIGSGLFGGSTLATINPAAGTSGTVTTFNPGVSTGGGIDMANFPCFDLQPGFSFTFSGCQPVTVSFTDTTGGPPGTWSYEWDFGDPVSGAANVSLLQNPTHQYPAAGTYQIRMVVSFTPAGLCLNPSYRDTVVRSITITSDTIITTLNTQDILCAGAATGSATVTVSTGAAPYNYQWTPPVSGGPVAAGLTAGNYAVNITDAGGCSQSYSIIIQEPDSLLPVVPVQTLGTDCSGSANGTATVIMGGGFPPYSYQWSVGTGSGTFANNLPPGNHLVTVTDANSCSITLPFTITSPVSFQASLSPPDAICEGNSITLIPVVQGGTTPFQYVWSNGSAGSTLTASPLISTSYTVTITDANGCTGSGPLSVQAVVIPGTPPPPPQVISVCAGQPVTLAALQGMDNYEWLVSAQPPAVSTGNQHTLTINPVPGTTFYSASFNTPQGCEGNQNFTVTVNILSLTPLSDTSICIGAAVVLNADAGLSSYAWTPVTGLSSPNVAQPLASPASTTAYTLVATDANGCTDSITTTVTVNAPVLPSPGDKVICKGDSALFNAAPGWVSYAWSPSAGLSSAMVNNPSASPAASTTYSLIATDINGCADTVTATVTVNDLNLVSPPDAVLCDGDSILLNTTPGLASYNWSPPAGLSSSNIFNPAASPSSTTTYWLMATDSNGCVDSVMINVTVSNPALSVTADTAVCPGSEAVLSATTGFSSYLWLPPSGLNTISGGVVIAQPDSTTAYTVMATDAAGCMDSASVTVTVYPTFVFALTDTGICPGQGVQLTAPAGLATYAWSPSAGLSSTTIPDPIAAPEQTRGYTLTATDTNGCAADATITITIYEAPGAGFSFTPENPSLLIPEVSFNDRSTNTSVWSWDFGDGTGSSLQNPTHTYGETGVFSVTLAVSSPEGCRDSVTQRLEVSPSSSLWLPDAFSPNGDGFNEFYKAESVNVPFQEMKVFNRFGELLFSGKDPAKGWDGTYNGSPAPTGAYVCIVRYSDGTNSIPLELVKHFSLIR